MIKNRVFPIIYMFIVTAFFTAILVTFSTYTKARVEANQALEFERAVVSAIPELEEQVASDREIHDAFVSQLRQPSDQTAGAYVYPKEGSITAFALPFEGQGFWAPIKGVIGIGPDQETILAIEFYEQNETPGLGARITEPEFQKQFIDLPMRSDERAIQLMRPGEPLSKGQVHAVTGATQTSVRVEKMMNDAVAEWKSKMQ